MLFKLSLLTVLIIPVVIEKCEKFLKLNINLLIIKFDHNS